MHLTIGGGRILLLRARDGQDWNKKTDEGEQFRHLPRGGCVNVAIADRCEPSS